MSIENDNYHADTARKSNSMMSVLAKRNGPQLFDGYYVSKTLAIPEQTESMALGEMVHCLVLEPEEFPHRFIIKPAGLDRRTKEGKASYANLLASGKTVASLDDYETAEGCANAILTHDSLAVLNQPAMIEKRIDFELDGVPMRCKPDWVDLDLQLIIDVKTTQDASPNGFAKSAGDFGYYRQAWIYREAVRLQTGIDCRFLFACVETTKPYSVACYEPSEAMMRAGENDAMSLLAEYRYRFESDDWLQDWSKGIVPLDMPAWFKQRNFYDEMRTR